MSSLDKTREALVRRLLVSPAAARLKPRLVDAYPRKVRIALPFDPSNRTEGDAIHGGVIAMLADIAGVAVAVAASRAPPSTGATRNLSLSFLAPALACDLEACAVLLHGGGRNCVARVTVSAASGEIVAEAHVAVALY